MTDHAVQIAALKKSLGHRGFAFFMEQGLGKTLTDYRDFERAVAEGEVTRKITFAPNSFKLGWADEAEKWGVNVDCHIFESGNDRANEAFLRKRFDRPPHLIINYEAARSPKTQEYIQQFSAGRRVWATADESIQIKTYDSAQTKALLSMEPWFAYKRALSGKPTTQGPHDLWAQMRWIGHMDRRYYPFKTAFCQMGGFKMKQVIGAQNEDVLSLLIDPYIFRATKADWTDLPPKVYTIREYSLSAEMRRMYKQMEDEFVLWLEDGDYVSVDAAITKYIKLAQIQAGFIIDPLGAVHWLVDHKQNPRLNALKSILSDEVRGKSIVVYNHKPIRGMLEQELAKYNPVFIRGGMEQAEIAEAKRQFNDNRNCRVICITKAAKYGHTLLGDQSDPDHACSSEIFFENTYSLDDRSQLEDRPHRHGQLQDSMTYYDLAGTPLDRNAVKALQRKESMFQSVFKNIRAVRD